MIIASPRGSEWRKWDLHIHSPASFFWNGGKQLQDMSPSELETEMGRFVTALNESDVSVFCLMDYWTFDWYLELRKYLRNHPGELQKTVFPGMELRIECPVDYRLNIHVILSDHLTKQQLEDFKSELVIRSIGRKLSNESLIEFAKTLDVSKAKVHGFTDPQQLADADLLQLGSKTAEITKESLQHAFEHIPQDAGYIILPYDTSDGLLNLDWGNHPHDDNYFMQSAHIFETRDQRNIDLFCGNTTPENTAFFENFYKTIGSCPKPCVSGSDAHAYGDYGKYPSNRITWIKADPTFEGLKQIIYEPSRSYIGTEPPANARVRQKPTKFIDTLTITRVEEYQENDGVWFKDVAIPLNSEMVAIIGNKGGGKSAIADIIGYVGGAKTVIESDGASFLTPDKFRKNSLASNFTATLRWQSTDTDDENLQAPKNEHTTEKVKYLPQHWFEELCNDLDGKKFNEELEKVVFSHLEPSERIEHNSFAELIRDKSQSANQEIAVLKTQLTDVNTEIVELLKKLHPDYKKELEEVVKQKQRELDAHEKAKPTEVAKPAATADEVTTQTTQEITQLNADIVNYEQQVKESVILITDLKQRQQKLSNFEAALLRVQREVSQLSTDYDLSKIAGEPIEKPLYKFTFEQSTIDAIKKKLGDSLTSEEQKHYSVEKIDQLPNLSQPQKAKLLKESAAAQLEIATGKRDELKKKLGKPQEKYQKYLEDKKQWDADKVKIEGSSDDPAEGTLNYLKNQIKSLEKEVPDALKGKKEQRKEISRQIFDHKHEIVSIYETIKQQVDSVLQIGVQSIEDYIISVEAGFQLSPGFIPETVGHINLRAKGSFMETDNARSQIKKLTEESELQTFEEVYELTQKILGALETDNRPEVDKNNTQRFLADQIRSPEEFLDHLFGLDYLKTNYQLKLDQKNLESLSPGEKGALLLVFYLMLDQDDIPLVIDQPEDNLDNESVAKILVKFIKDAKHRRQIIMVTHNPNLAVVADAEQVIYVNIDKSDKNTFSFISGAIENDTVNRKIVDVLEGTMPAFDKRRLRYLK